MELTSRSRVGALPHFRNAARRWLEAARVRRLRREQARALSRLSDHLLRDIGCEDRITFRLPKPDYHWHR